MDRLSEVGKWMDHNGAAIYGSSAWHVTDEKVEWSQDAEKLTLALPAEAPGGFVATFRVKLGR